MLRVAMDDDRRRFAIVMIDRWLRLQDLRGRRFLARRSGGNRANRYDKFRQSNADKSESPVKRR